MFFMPLFLPTRLRIVLFPVWLRRAWSYLSLWFERRFPPIPPFAALNSGNQHFASAPKLIKRHGLIERGRRDGTENHPAPEAMIETQTEHLICDEAEHALGRMQTNARHALAERNCDLAALDAHPLPQHFRQVERQTLGELRHRLETERPELEVAKKAELAEERLFKRFQRDNGLQRAPRPAKPLWISLGVLILIATLESWLNARLLAQVSEGGLLGGWFLSIGLSLMNLVFSALLGFVFLRGCHHVRWWRKWLSGGLFTLGLGVLAVFHLAVGNYRSLLETAMVKGETRIPFGEAVTSIFAGHMDLASTEALLLIFLGMTGSLVAIFDAYCNFDDVYPGYGAAWRAYQRTKDEFETIRDESKTALEDITGKALEGLAARMEALRGLETYCWDLDGAHRARALEIESTAITALRAYREANLSIRTAEPPAYFGLYPEFKGRDWRDARATAERLSWMAQEPSALLDEIRERLQVYLRDLLAWFFETYLPDIEGRAKQQADNDERLFMNERNLGKDLQPPPLEAAKPRPPAGPKSPGEGRDREMSAYYGGDLQPEPPPSVPPKRGNGADVGNDPAGEGIDRSRAEKNDPGTAEWKH